MSGPRHALDAVGPRAIEPNLATRVQYGLYRQDRDPAGSAAQRQDRLFDLGIRRAPSSRSQALGTPGLWGSASSVRMPPSRIDDSIEDVRVIDRSTALDYFGALTKTAHAMLSPVSAAEDMLDRIIQMHGRSAVGDALIRAGRQHTGKSRAWKSFLRSMPKEKSDWLSVSRKGNHRKRVDLLQKRLYAPVPSTSGGCLVKVFPYCDGKPPGFHPASSSTLKRVASDLRHMLSGETRTEVGMQHRNGKYRFFLERSTPDSLMSRYADRFMRVMDSTIMKRAGIAARGGTVFLEVYEAENRWSEVAA